MLKILHVNGFAAGSPSGSADTANTPTLTSADRLVPSKNQVEYANACGLPKSKARTMTSDEVSSFITQNKEKLDAFKALHDGRGFATGEQRETATRKNLIPPEGFENITSIDMATRINAAKEARQRSDRQIAAVLKIAPQHGFKITGDEPELQTMDGCSRFLTHLNFLKDKMSPEQQSKAASCGIPLNADELNKLTREDYGEVYAQWRLNEPGFYTFWAKYGNKYMYKAYNPLKTP